MIEDILTRVPEWARGIASWLWEDHKQELIYAGVGVVWAVVRASGKTVVSGRTGLKFSFGRATAELGPGFYPLLPFLQIVRTLPTRSRTLDLSAQRVVTDEGLVFDVDANLVYRVVDVRRALVEIDDLVQGMHQMLALSVQEVVRPRTRAELYASDALEAELARRMSARLEPWGVAVEHAGFPSLRPSEASLRITQLARLGGEREVACTRMGRDGIGPAAALALASQAPRIVPRTRVLAARDRARKTERLRAWLAREAERESGRRIALARRRESPFQRRAREQREQRRAERSRRE